MRIHLLFPLILILLVSFGCDNNNSGGTDSDFFANTGNPPFESDPSWYPTGYLFVDNGQVQGSNKNPEIQ